MARPICLLLPLMLGALFSVPVVQAQSAVHLTQSGDTLIALGQKYLSHPAQWPILQALNHLHDPRSLPVGYKLAIPARLLKREAALAEMGPVHGDVRLADQVAQTGTRVAEGQLIQTGEDGFATIKLADGSILTLQPRSRLSLEEHRQLKGVGAWRTRLQLSNGRVENQVQNQGKVGSYRVQTPSVVLAVRGTAFRVQADGDTARAEVTEGQVGAAQQGHSVLLTPGQGLVSQTGRSGMTAVDLLPAPDLSHMPQLFERPLLRIPLPAAEQIYRVQIGRDERFQDVLAEDLGRDGMARFVNLADGPYWLRVRAVAGNGLEGRDAVRAFTLKARPEPPIALQPRPKGKIRGEDLSLRWTQPQDAATYRLELRRADTGEILGQWQNVAAAEFVPPRKLGVGEYIWRLASTRQDGDQGPWSDDYRFSIKPAQTPADPPAIEWDRVHFAWTGEPGQRFDLEVAQDAGFASPLLRRQLAETQADIERPADGRYFLRLRAIDGDGYVGPWTAAQAFEVPSKPWWLLLLALPLL